MFLLAHLGEPGRPEAHDILWNRLADWGLQQDYRDLSNLATNQVHGARAGIARPPTHNRDRGTWSWHQYLEPRNKDFSPFSVPRKARGAPLPDSRKHLTAPGGVPLPPPRCWPRGIRMYSGPLVLLCGPRAWASETLVLLVQHLEFLEFL